MLTKVVEPELGFLVLFTDSKSDESLASYDVSKFPLLIVGYSQCIIFDLKLAYDTARVVVRFTAKTGILKCKRSSLGFGPMDPKSSFAKLVKMRKHLLTSTGDSVDDHRGAAGVILVVLRLLLFSG